MSVASVWPGVSVMVMSTLMVRSSMNRMNHEIAGRIAAYLDYASMFDLSRINAAFNQGVRDEIARKQHTGSQSWDGHGYPGRMILCEDDKEFDQHKAELENSDERAMLKYKDGVHFIRGVTEVTQEHFTIQSIQKDKFEALEYDENECWVLWDPSKRAQWITYRNQNDEWMARKLDDDLKMETQIAVNKLKTEGQSYRVIGSKYAILIETIVGKTPSLCDRKTVNYGLYDFSVEFGIGELIGRVDVSAYSLTAIRESEDHNDYPKIIGVGIDDENRNLRKVWELSFVKGVKPLMKSEIQVMMNEDSESKLTEDGRHLVIYDHSRLLVMDVINGEIKISENLRKFSMTVGPFDSPRLSNILVNDRYLVLNFSNRNGRYGLHFHAAFDLQTCEMIGPLSDTRQWTVTRWISQDLLLLTENSPEFMAVNVRNPHQLFDLKVKGDGFDFDQQFFYDEDYVNIREFFESDPDETDQSDDEYD